MSELKTSRRETFEIRPYQEADLESVMQIVEIAWAPIYAGYREAMGDELYFAFYPDWKARKRSYMEKHLAKGTTFVTLDGARIIAFCSYNHEPGAVTGEVADNGVHSDYLGRGIGSAQNRWIMATLQELGVKYVRVHTGLDDAHAGARRAYEAAGFDHSVPSVIYYRKL